MEKAHRTIEISSPAAKDPTPALRWEVHLLREQPAKVLLVLPVVAVSLFVCYLISQSLLLLVASLLLFMSSLAEYLFPVRYEISDRGASSRALVRRVSIEWDRVKRCCVDDHGIKLSPLARPSRLEAYRGVYLRFGRSAAERHRIVEFVRKIRDERAGS